MSDNVTETALNNFNNNIQELVSLGLVTADERLTLLGIAWKKDKVVPIAEVPVAAEPVVAEPVAVAKPAKPKPVPVKKVVRMYPAPELVDDFIKWFYVTPEQHLYNVKRGQYECRLGNVKLKTAHTLLFHSEVKNSRWSGDANAIKVPKNAENVVGIRPIDSKVGIFNASRILYGHNSNPQKRPQAAAEAAGAVPIPFETVVSEKDGIGLDLAKLQIVDWTNTERLIIPPVARKRRWSGSFYIVDRHFAGAIVVRIDDQYFLFDTDRQELKHFGFNPFFTQLSAPVNSVAEAYQLLLPDEVKMAMLEGRNVQRQGEFFFIPLADTESWTYATTAVGVGPMLRFGKLQQDLLEVGAAHYNWLQAARLVQVERFINRCKEHTVGMLPESSALIQDARTILTSYVDYLKVRVGSHIAQGKYANADLIQQVIERDIKSTDNMMGYIQTSEYAKGPTKTHLNSEALELRQSCSIVDNHTPVIPQGTMALQFGVMFDLSIGAASSTGGRGAHQHRATAVLQSKTQPGVVLAIGAVVHSGRQHQPLFLDCWHKVVGNTAIRSFTVSGDVD